MKAKRTDTATFEADLDALLDGARPGVARTTRRLVGLLRRQHPDLTPAVRAGWRSINFRHPRAGYVCGVFAQTEDTLLGFENGRLLDNSAGLLEGETLKKVRFIRFRPGDRIPAGDIGALIAEAIALRA